VGGKFGPFLEVALWFAHHLAQVFCSLYRGLIALDAVKAVTAAGRGELFLENGLNTGDAFSVGGCLNLILLAGEEREGRLGHDLGKFLRLLQKFVLQVLEVLTVVLVLDLQQFNYER
jgi:hypothetical protein